jgi:hypothetical protein
VLKFADFRPCCRLLLPLFESGGAAAPLLFDFLAPLRTLLLEEEVGVAAAASEDVMYREWFPFPLARLLFRLFSKLSSLLSEGQEVESRLAPPPPEFPLPSLPDDVLERPRRDASAFSRRMR